jgi:DNA-binding protein HU-beta
VNRAELIDQIRDRLGIDKRAAENAVDAVFDSIQRAVAAGEKVALTGFGVFERVDRAARTGRNPRTGAAVKIKKTSVPKFRPGTQFKGVVSGAVKLGKVADAATKAAAKSAGASARTAGRTAASAPGRAATAARGAATKATRGPARKASPAKATKATAKKSTAKKSTAKKTTGTKTAAKKSTAKKSTAKKTARR